VARWDAAWFRRLDTELALLPHRSVEEQRAIRRALATDPVAFAMIYMRRHIRSKELGTVTFAEVHYEWAQIALSWREPVTAPEQGRHAFIAPRSCGKSTWWFLILPMWAAANGVVKFTAAFASAAAQAEAHLASFKHELETNALLRADFPELCTPARKVSGGTVADRSGMLHTSSGFVFAARGVDSAVLGMKVGDQRPDLLVLDDVEPDEASYSPLLAEKRLGTVLDAILPLNIYARVALVGTVTMPGSVIHQCVKQAVGTDPEPWVAEQRIHCHYTPAILANDDGTERSVWPEKWSVEWLQSIRHTRQYAKNYANDPMGRDGSYWNMEDFRYGELDGVTRLALFIDPIVKDRTKTSDYTGLAVVGWAPATTDVPYSRCVVLHAEGVRLTGALLRQHVVRKILPAYPRVRKVVIETNQGGDLWREVFHDLPGIKVETHTTQDSKETRFARALDFYQRFRVLHARRIPVLEEQAVSFPKGAYDDVIDAACAGVLYFLDDRRVRVGGRQAAYQ
jgi:hypothetical protein